MYVTRSTRSSSNTNRAGVLRGSGLEYEEEHMEIRLERLWSPECAEETECSLCGETFTLGVVIARAVTKYGQDGGEVCPECAVYLSAGPMGRARSGAFPNLEEFVRRLDEWETPVYASDAELWEDFGKIAEE